MNTMSDAINHLRPGGRGGGGHASIVKGVAMSWSRLPRRLVQ